MQHVPKLIIKTSQIPNSGKGTFTKTFIPKGALICEYEGEIIDEEEAERRAQVFNADSYFFDVGDDLTLDAMYKYDCPARYINDAWGLKRVKGLTNNTQYILDDSEKRIYVYASRDILPGEELFASYGRSYWRMIKEQNETFNILSEEIILT